MAVIHHVSRQPACKNSRSCLLLPVNAQNCISGLYLSGGRLSDFGKLICICHDRDNCGRMACVSDLFQIDGKKFLTFPDGLTFLYTALKAVSLHIHCVNANMNQNLKSTCLNADRMKRVRNLYNPAVCRRDDPADFLP